MNTIHSRTDFDYVFSPPLANLINSPNGQIIVFEGSTSVGKTLFANDHFPTAAFIFREFDVDTDANKALDFSQHTDSDVIVADEVEYIKMDSVVTMCELAQSERKKIVLLVQEIDGFGVNFLDRYKHITTVFDFNSSTIENLNSRPYRS